MRLIGSIVLAAGNSSRLGQPKQALPYQQKSLLQHVVDEVRAAALTPLIVVEGAVPTGAGDLTEAGVTRVYNAQWAEGMASSIRVGLTELLRQQPDADGVIITVCDQPFVSAALFQQLIQQQKETGQEIVACAYADTLGTPVLFHKKYFADLLRLKGQEGAKRLLQRYRAEVAAVPFPLGKIDIDTPEDYRRLLEHEE